MAGDVIDIADARRARDVRRLLAIAAGALLIYFLLWKKPEVPT